MNNLTRIIIAILFGIVIIIASIISSQFENKPYRLLKNDNSQQAKQVDEVHPPEFLIDKTTVRIPHSNFLPTDDWKTYKNTILNYEIKYPKEWYVLERGFSSEENELGYFREIILTPTLSVDSPNRRDLNRMDIPWARIAISVKKRPIGQTLEDWLIKQAEQGGPGTDATLQYVIIPKYVGQDSSVTNFSATESEREFIGTAEFNTDKWKNAYFELAQDKVLILSFINEVADSNFSEIFYTIIQTLKFRQGN